MNYVLWAVDEGEYLCDLAYGPLGFCLSALADELFNRPDVDSYVVETTDGTVILEHEV